MLNSTKSLLASVTIYCRSNSIVKSCNRAFTDLLGFTESEIKNIPLADKLLLGEEASFLTLEALFSAARVSDEGVFTKAKMFNSLHYAVTIELHCVYKKEDTFELYFHVIENKSIDPISGLPNGWALISRINYLSRNQHLTLKNMVLIVVEADNFSSINFRYDYTTGDEYLAVLGRKLQDIFKGFAFVIRFSNAKFAILIEDYEKLSPPVLTTKVVQICKSLCTELEKPVKLSNNIEIIKSFSIGVSSPNFPYDSYLSMQIAAESETQKSKKYSINTYSIASSDPQSDFLTRKLIIEALPQAMIQSDIKIHYQPQYDILTEQLIGLEALSRWYEPTLGHIPPNIFVAIAEDIGMHFEFDLWVFEKVCHQIMEWKQEKITVPRIAVNVSFKTMEMSTLIVRIQQILKKTACPCYLLELEITETSSFHDSHMLSRNILNVKSLGIHIAIDDFGTGYSSLNLIRTFHLSIDKLKLDRSLIDKVCETELDKNFTRHIIELGKILNISVLAEGVETQEQFELLTELGCNSVQGYYFSKAQNSEDIKILLNKS